MLTHTPCTKEVVSRASTALAGPTNMDTEAWHEAVATTANFNQPSVTRIVRATRAPQPVAQETRNRRRQSRPSTRPGFRRTGPAASVTTNARQNSHHDQQPQATPVGQSNRPYSSRRGVPEDYNAFRPCHCVCTECHARFWYEERLSRLIGQQQVNRSKEDM